MKILLLSCIVLTCLSVSHGDYFYESGTNPDGSTWSTWKETYSYSYGPSEEPMRMNNFYNASNFINQHNQQYNQNQQNHSVGHNAHSGMTNDEFRNNMMGLQNEQNCQNGSRTYKAPDNPNIPNTVDYREKGYVTQIRNQGQCGACWAFVAVGSLEGQHKRITGNLVELSEQNLIDCSYKQGNSGCSGGIMCKAFEYAATTPGVDSEQSYPYVGNTGSNQCHYKPNDAASPVGGYLEIPKGDEQTLLAAVGLLGPVAAAFDGSPMSFRYYRNGIFSDPTCSSSALSHALTIIGYGSENGQDYWLVKNSWGKSWGMKGFGKVLRGSNMCGIATRAVFPVLHRNSDGSPKLEGPAAS